MADEHMPNDGATINKLGDLAGEARLRRVSMLAWRDLDDPEAGGSELHAHRIATLWAEAGLEVTMRTSFAAGKPQVSWRDGYRVIRKAGRYLVFPRAAFSEMMGWHGGRDGLVEIWNGMPFFSPVWARTPNITFLHHHHAEMWDMTLPPRLAKLGRFVESRLAPPLYRRTPIVTLSESSKRELVDEMGFKRDRVTVVSPGVDARFTPAGDKSPTPLVVAVGRLVPVKRFDMLVEALIALKPEHPDLEAVIVGEGYKRDELAAQIHAAGGEDWIRLPGRMSDDDLRDLYRRAWIVASASQREGWGMTLTEAGACATPSVVTRIAGHLDAVDEGHSGLIVDGRDDMVSALDRVLRDGALREQLTAGALEHSARFTWHATALGTLEVLAAEAQRHRRSHRK
jgi:glycosyltransferase involved in cell wall biosynthesis